MPGKPYKLDHQGVPRLDKVEIDDRDRRQQEVKQFATAIYDLNELWERLVTDRDAFNHELTQFPHHGFRRTSLIQGSDEMKPGKTTKRKIIDDKDEGTKIDVSVLGSTMDKSEEARARRAERSKESRRWHSFLKMAPYFDVLGTSALFKPDIGYALSILGAYGNGMKHPDPEVRKSSIEILDVIAQGTLIKLNADLEQTGFNDHSPLKQKYAKDAKSVIDAIFRLLYSPHFGIRDSNEEVQSLAISLDSDLIDASLFIKGIIKADEIAPRKIIY